MALYAEHWAYNWLDYYPATIKILKIYRNGIIKGHINNNTVRAIIIYDKGKTFKRNFHGNFKMGKNKIIWDNSWKSEIDNSLSTIEYRLSIQQTVSNVNDNNAILSHSIDKTIPDNELETTTIPTEEARNKDAVTTTLYTTTQEQPVQPQLPKDPCTQNPIDDAWKEYCEAKAYNAKIKQEEEADAKAAEQEAKEEEEYQKRLDAWNEEEKQSNIDFIKSREAQRKKADKIWKEEDKAFNESVAKDQAQRKAKQAEIEKAHKIIDRFGDDYETQRAAHKKIEALSKTADTQKAKKIKNAIRKQFYDSKQIKLQGEAEFQASRAKELGKKEKYLNTVKDTSLTVNKVLARIDEAVDPLEIGNKILSIQENSYDAIDSYSKGGLSKVADDFIEKKANELSNDWAGFTKDTIEKYKQYHSKKGLKLKPDEKYYDKNGKRLTRVNIYQRVYDKKGNEVSFSFGRRLFKKTFNKLNDDYNTIQETAEHIKNIKEGVMNGDINKVANEALEMTEKEDEGENDTKDESHKSKEQ